MSLAFLCLVLAGLGFAGTVATGAALATGVSGVAKDLTVLGFIGAVHVLLLAFVGGLWLIG